MDVRNSSKEPGGYLKKVKKNDMVQALRGTGHATSVFLG
jgi:hypothetical protein